MSDADDEGRGRLGDLLGTGDSDDVEEQPDDDEPAGDREITHEITLEFEDDPVGVYDLSRYRNNDVSVVLLSAFADGYQALAIDLASDGEVLETEVIGDAEDYGRVVSMCEYWLDQNPKGILGGEEGGGILDRLKGGGE